MKVKEAMSGEAKGFLASSPQSRRPLGGESSPLNEGVGQS